MGIDVKEQNISNFSPDLLKLLLTDKTTKKYIRWGSDNYKSYGLEYYTDQEIQPQLIIGKHNDIIRPRVMKEAEQQVKRTRDKAEVFTPSWVCNEQNNLIDEAWFGKTNVFNIPVEKSWNTITKRIEFPKRKSWKRYVDARRMEISCGEAPYLVSRYDTVTGEAIPIENRIGLLDRKMRVLSENVSDDQEWKKWAVRAVQSCYGYDFQGDNVLLARENILFTYVDYYKARFTVEPSLQELKTIANVVAWNIWQMNGITMTAPYSLADPVYQQMSLFDLPGWNNDEREELDFVEKSNEIPCKIFDWRSKESIEFKSLKSEE